MEGEFPRAISLFRTSQSYVAQARHQIPSVLAMVWFGVYAPGKRQRVRERKRARECQRERESVRERERQRVRERERESERERERERERHIGICMFNV